MKDNLKRIKVGIVANEFFGHEVGGFGGFGWAAQQAARLFNHHPEQGFEALFLSRTLPPAAGDGRAHDTPLITREGGRWSGLRRMWSERPDLLLFIDYRPSYRFFAGAFPRTPIVVWVRDPRTPEDVRKVNTLLFPGEAGTRPDGTNGIDCTSLGTIVRASRLLARPVLFATVAPHLADKAPDTYDVTPPEVALLPNPLNLYPDTDNVSKSERPRVVFLGRLDPIKRPWVFAELARRFPEVEFLFLGHSHFEGDGRWQTAHLPPNVRRLGHVDGGEKLRLLSSAWALVNTSIHEGLAVSFLEALACETPIVSCQNAGGLVERFGAYVGRWDGDGLASLPVFAEALTELLRDQETRARLGRAGRAWVTETHNAARFLEAFRSLCVRAGLKPLPTAAAPL